MHRDTADKHPWRCGGGGGSPGSHMLPRRPGLPGLLMRNGWLMRPWGIPWESTGGPSQRVEKTKAEQGWERENGGAKISVRC